DFRARRRDETRAQGFVQVGLRRDRPRLVLAQHPRDRLVPTGLGHAPGRRVDPGAEEVGDWRAGRLSSAQAARAPGSNSGGHGRSHRPGTRRRFGRRRRRRASGTFLVPLGLGLGLSGRVPGDPFGERLRGVRGRSRRGTCGEPPGTPPRLWPAVRGRSSGRRDRRLLRGPSPSPLRHSHLCCFHRGRRHRRSCWGRGHRRLRPRPCLCRRRPLVLAPPRDPPGEPRQPQPPRSQRKHRRLLPCSRRFLSVPAAASAAAAPVAAPAA
ncbi:unnamed protein product, partial [Scytosiphon promiscuus]